MNKLRLRTFQIVFSYLIFSGFLLAQPPYYTKSKKAISLYETAFKQYELLYFEQAKTNLEQALQKDDQFIEAYILLGEIAKVKNHQDEAIRHFQKAIAINGDYPSIAWLGLAQIYQSNGNYTDAKDDFLKFLSFKKFKDEYSSYVLKSIKKCEFAIEMMKHPVDFSPENLGPMINSPISEYWPSLTADDSIMFFTVSDREDNSASVEHLYFSTKSAKGWNRATRISERSEGAQTISADGKTMVFTVCPRPVGNCHLYISKKKGKTWSKPVIMESPITSDQYKETQPSLSADGKTLYFVSNRPGGLGKLDIWQSNMKADGSWDDPVNLGDSINSPENEFAPFIHQDNQTLYFSSLGRLGMGGLDIFISRKNEKGEWKLAQNAGYPVNTYHDEESLIVTADGELGLISSNMDGGYGQKDIYQFKMPQYLRSKKAFYTKGLVYDSKSLKRLNAKIDIANLENQSNLLTETDEENGEFLVCLSPGKTYAFNVNKPGYMFYSENLFLKDSNMYIKIPLIPVELGQSVILRNIFFDLDSYQLKPESFPELQRLVVFLKSNKVSIEIQGHTDNSGTLLHNQTLSENRAKSVFDYLISNGIEKKIMKYKGYGLSRPIAGNDTEAGRAKNRRTEFVIIGKEQ